MLSDNWRPRLSSGVLDYPPHQNNYYFRSDSVVFVPENSPEISDSTQFKYRKDLVWEMYEVHGFSEKHDLCFRVVLYSIYVIGHVITC